MNDEESRILAQIDAVERLSNGCAARNSVFGSSLAILSDLIDGCLLDVAIESHRRAWQGEEIKDRAEDLAQDAPAPPPEILKTWGQKNDRDFFGQQLQRMQVEMIDCVHCHRQVPPTRFAPHLEKCLGKGRNASRLARRPQGNTSSQQMHPPQQQQQPHKAKKSSQSLQHAPPLPKQRKAVSTLPAPPPAASLAEASFSDSFNFDSPLDFQSSDLEDKFDAMDGGLRGDFDEDSELTSMLYGSGANKAKRKLGGDVGNSNGKMRRKVRSLLAERVKLMHLVAYLNPRSASADAMDAGVAQAISHSADTFRKLATSTDRNSKLSRQEDVQCILDNVCCVVSQRESTKDKICANSVNCPIHTNQQRQEVRRHLKAATGGGGLPDLLGNARRPCQDLLRAGDPCSAVQRVIATPAPGERSHAASCVACWKARASPVDVQGVYRPCERGTPGCAAPLRLREALRHHA
ncbi:hypothetical protein CYMTET_24738 [Cymbomonas tetramitiformis]|uniref:SAGA-associated factor 11 n=1 Tax=Cymbomonas tetramitiformis TaxID=36881 RepID=A0AAE0FVB3_9CHLO|nr:hypothetical protein CYMTET_24738 [Cymbomonas tetramitiformis]